MFFGRKRQEVLFEGPFDAILHYPIIVVFRRDHFVPVVAKRVLLSSQLLGGERAKLHPFERTLVLGAGRERHNRYFIRRVRNRRKKVRGGRRPAKGAIDLLLDVHNLQIVDA